MSKDKSIRDQLIEYNNILSKLDMNNLSEEEIKMCHELATFCSLNQNCSSTFEQILKEDILLQSVCENLCRIFALYGFFLEIDAARICAADKNQSLDKFFKYRQSYKDLIQCEMNLLKKLGLYFDKNLTTNDHSSLLVTKIAFIGSGPLPNSSMIILNDFAPDADIYNIDLCEEANQLAPIITEQILPSNLSKKMHFITQDIGEKPLPIQVQSILNECQLIYLGAFVGMNENEKLNILKNIVNNENKIQYFIIRTAEGIWQIIMPKITTENISKLQADTNDLQDNKEKKFLFQIKGVHHTLDNYGIISIIATNI